MMSPKAGFLGATGLVLCLISANAPAPQAAQTKTKPTAKPNAKPQKPTSGKDLYNRKCAACHGANGKGGAAFPKPLIGTRSVNELGKFIAQQMPPGPVKTPAAEATKIAAYMHEAFYSPVAQDRNRPARVELQRLTVRQLRNAITDLIDGDRDPSIFNKTGGLQARYWDGRMWKGEPLIERTDPQVKFDFGTAGPAITGTKQFDPYNFAVMWTGAVIAPDTGEYEFVVRSDQAIKLFLNNDQKPVIDAMVRSGPENEFRVTAFLQAGRAYPIRFEFSKAVYGVEDQDKRKKKPPVPAFVSLNWRRPKLAEEPIPSRFLAPGWAPETYVVSNPFPADDRSIGYERGTTVNRAWDEATTEAAMNAAIYVSENAKAKIGVELTDPTAREKAKAFATQLATRAFRRPLTPEQQAIFVDKHFQESVPVEEGLRRSILLVLKSPRFLFREVHETDAYAKAAHLSFGLWDTVPPVPLLTAAKNGELDKPDTLARIALSMTEHPRARQKLMEFLLAWLKVDETPDLVKSKKQFPGFDDTVSTDLRSSLELYLEKTALTPDGSYTKLFAEKAYPVTPKIAPLYGVPKPDAEVRSVALDGGTRAGVLMHPYVLSRFAYLETSSPIHRGVLIARSMLGRVLQPPPAAFAPLAASLHPNLTTRERVAMQTKPEACNTCHAMINPLGFSLERYDAIGRVRQKENGKPVDTTGFYKTRTGELVRFTGAGDLSRFLATSEEAQSAFAEKLFHHVVKQPALAYRPTLVSDLRKSFAANGFQLRKLMAEAAVQTIPSAQASPTP